MKRHLLLTVSVLLLVCAFAQNEPFFYTGVPVTRNGTALNKAWWGGLNVPQYSQMDLDGDGVPDLFVFDRGSNKALGFRRLPGNAPGGYTLMHDFDLVPPFRDLEEWALLRDYNGDGKPDLFTYISENAGIAVYKNTSIDGSLRFERASAMLGSYYPPQSPNLYIYPSDVPGLVDIDGDGDLDILAFSILGAFVDYHKNMSMEYYGTPDSLVYVRRSDCWGYFFENNDDNGVTLHHDCPYNLPGAEFNGLPPSASAGLRHAGSTVTPIDLNGDGVLDLLLGDVDARSMVALINGGRLDSAHMVSADMNFPNYDVPVDLPTFPAAYHVDVDNDGKLDLIVAPNLPGESLDRTGSWFYRNTSANAIPHFARTSTDLFQGDMIDVGEGAYPVFFDENGDGLMDLIIANSASYFGPHDYRSGFTLLRNTGTSTAPAFHVVTDDLWNMSTSGLGIDLLPTFGDLNGDGRPDMIVGDLGGYLHWYTNTGSGTSAEMTLQTQRIRDVNNTVIDVGFNAAPFLFDVDGDGLLDLIVGERVGNLNHYRNTGTASAPAWTLVTETLGGVDLRPPFHAAGYSVPFLFRNEQGGIDLVSGSANGYLHHFADISAQLGGTWAGTARWLNIREGDRSALAMYDLHGSGASDIVVGNFRGGVGFWAKDRSLTQRRPEARSVNAVFHLVPNPAQSMVELQLPEHISGTTHADVYDTMGRHVLRWELKGQRTMLALDGLKPGSYLVRPYPSNMPPQRLIVLHR